jgi:hypothetical protein
MTTLCFSIYKLTSKVNIKNAAFNMYEGNHPTAVHKSIFLFFLVRNLYGDLDETCFYKDKSVY